MEHEFFDLTNPQKAIWLTEQFYKGKNINNVCGTLYIKKALDFNLFEQSINLFIKNNDSVRIKLRLQENGEIKQYFDEYQYIHIDTVNVYSEKDLKQLQNSVVSEVFNLLDSNLFHFVIFKFPNNNGGVIANFHHLISDSWSHGILSNQLLSNYCKLLNNEEIIDNSSYSYKEYISTENDYINSAKFLKDKAYWDNIYSTIPENATIPASLNSNINSLEAKRLQLNINGSTLSEITEYCTSHKITPFNFYMSILGLYISRVSNLDDFVIGTPILNRTNYAEKHTTGMFIKTIPFRISLDYNLRFTDFVSQIAVNSIGMLKHQRYSYQYIIEDLRKQDSSLPTLYNIMFSYQITKMTDNNDIFPHTNTWSFTGNTSDDLDIHMLEYDDSTNSNLNVMYDYRTSKYTESDIREIHSRILYIIKQVIENDQILLKDIDAITEEEKNKILYQFNSNKIDIPSNLTLDKMFKDIVLKNRNNTAIISSTNSITYQELDELSNKLANILLDNGVQPQDIIGVCMNRSIELLISIWAILKIGAIYMPMHTKYPTDRLRYMIENSNCHLIITNSIMSTSFDDCVKEIIFNNINEISSNKSNIITASINENDIAYVIYTSGSTGKPKGVQITHKNLINFLYSFNNSYGKIDTNDSLLASTNISFDVSIFELFISILNGAKLILYNEEYITDIINYTNWIINNEITMLYIPPNILNEVYTILKNSSADIKINKLLVGVEGIKKSTLNKYFILNKNMTIVNGYGPTETTICATSLVYKKDTTDDSYVSIGKPLSNNKIYILNKNNLSQPVNVLGEVYISGYGVGKGYINNTAENNKRFIPNTFDNSSQFMYKTGDLAKWNKDGTISFSGRADTQIKLHGYRIELSEINNAVSQYPYITNSLTTVREINSQKYIVTYFTSYRKIEINNLELFLKELLPFYMIPNYYIQLDDFPLTANGKINAKILPLPKIVSTVKYVAPSTKLEKILCSIWESLFNKEKISILDNFFNLGGDSLTAIKFQIEALKYDISISYGDIFHYPTIQRLAEKNQKSQPQFVDTPEYDYSRINSLLGYNSVSNIPKQHVPKTFTGNILLLGTTGFLGSHILDAFFNNCSGIVYCLVRSKGTLDEEERLKKTLNFYFGNKYASYFCKKIKIITGDISLEHFGLSDELYNKLGNSVDVVINSAALVKHYGDFKLFDSINVVGTQHSIDFCKDFHKKLYHISTISVSGASTPEDDSSTERFIFDETKFYIGQNLNNAYIYTKFEAEKIVLENINSGLDACILRIGNISNRFSDSRFQINTTDNAYINRLKAFFKLGVLPKQLADHSIEFTPVDACAEAIIKIVMNNPKFTVFHLFDTNLISIPNLVEIFNSLGYNLDFVSKKEFSDVLNKFLLDDTLKDSISGIVPDLDEKKHLNLVSNVLPNADFTTRYLNSLGFYWPIIDANYITNYILYFKNIGYLE